MFARFRRLLNQFFRGARIIDNEPLNKASLVVIIIIDIFILINVFTGLDDISRWYISPSRAYPCYSEWENYRTKTSKDKDYEAVKLAFPYEMNRSNFQQVYRQAEVGSLGKVSAVCLDYAGRKDEINNPANRQIIKVIEQKQNQINTLVRLNGDIRNQYDSTLLEKIAGQTRDRSINIVGAEKAKQELNRNNREIASLNREISTDKNEILAKPESVAFLSLLKNNENFIQVERGYQRASFWYPSIQLALQSFFLLPLIFAALIVHRLAQRKRYGLVSLISWHLLVIFLIPLLIKVFEFLQIGVIFQFIFDLVSAIFGGLLFLISYIYILIIPLIGFGIIKFFQKVVFNTKVQAASRVQKSRCIKCAKKIRHHDAYCPHCGSYQYVECQNCHNLTYKYLPYCKQCGQSSLSSSFPPH